MDFGFVKISRRDFYECGFRPITQKTIRVPIQFMLICIFFLLYDIELVFLFPFVSGFTFTGLYDILLFSSNIRVSKSRSMIVFK